MAIAFKHPEPDFAGAVEGGRRYHWFVRVAGRVYLSSTLWLDGPPRTRVYAFLLELRPDGEGVLVCGFANAKRIPGCGGRGCTPGP